MKSIRVGALKELCSLPERYSAAQTAWYFLGGYAPSSRPPRFEQSCQSDPGLVRARGKRGEGSKEYRDVALLLPPGLWSDS
jgi:hypothetical protein